MSMIEDWPNEEEQEAARALGCTCEQVTEQNTGPNLQQAEFEQDPYCVEHGDRTIMRATIDKYRRALVEVVFKGLL